MPIFSCRATASPIVSASSVLPDPTSPARITNGGRRRTVSRSARGPGWCRCAQVRQPSRVDKQTQNLSQAALLVVETDEQGQPRLGLEIGIGDASLEEHIQSGLGVHQKLLTQARSRARPPDE